VPDRFAPAGVFFLPEVPDRWRQDAHGSERLNRETGGLDSGSVPSFLGLIADVGVLS
jgi:hypothetical protein